MSEIQKKIEATVLIKWDGTKIIVPIPYQTVDTLIKASESLQIGKEHSIRCKAINERYGYNSSDEIEIYILHHYKNNYNQLMEFVKDRRKAKLSLNKEVVNNYVKDNFGYMSTKQ